MVLREYLIIFLLYSPPPPLLPPSIQTGHKGADVRISLTFGFLATNECWNRMMRTIHIILLITDLEAVLCVEVLKKA